MAMETNLDFEEFKERFNFLKLTQKWNHYDTKKNKTNEFTFY